MTAGIFPSVQTLRFQSVNSSTLSFPNTISTPQASKVSLYAASSTGMGHYNHQASFPNYCKSKYFLPSQIWLTFYSNHLDSSSSYEKSEFHLEEW